MKKDEIETIISFGKTDKEANIWTNDIKIIRKMKKLKAIKNDQNSFSIPINWIHIYKPRSHTKKQKEIIKDILYEINPNIKEKKALKEKPKKQPLLSDITVWKI